MQSIQTPSTTPEWAFAQASHLMQCWSAQAGYNPLPVIAAEGCYLYLSDGRRIFDLRSSHECNQLGFNHPAVVEAIQRQAASICYVTDDFATEATGKLIEKLAYLTPGQAEGKRIWLGQSGAGAVEAAIKAARFWARIRLEEKGWAATDSPKQYPFPYKIVARHRAWHGSTLGATSAGGDPRRWFTEPHTAPGFVFAPDAYCYRCPLGHAGHEHCGLACARYLEQIIDAEGGNSGVCAVLIEPVVGSNGIIPPPPGYLQALRELCDRRDLLLIVDETMTGFGRTGAMFAVDHWGIEPDILILGKALGAGMPLSAAVFSQKVARVFEENLFGHGQSHAGHALGCAAALAGIEAMQSEQLVQRSAELGAFLLDLLRQRLAPHPLVGDIRGLGLFCTVELVQDQLTKVPLRSPMDKYAESPIKAMAAWLLELKGIYMPGDKFGLWVVPPLVVTREELVWIVESLAEALEAVAG